MMKMNGHDGAMEMAVLPSPTRAQIKQDTIETIVELYDSGMVSPALIAAAFENTITPAYALQVLQDTGRHKPRRSLRDTIAGLPEDVATRLRLITDTRAKMRNKR
jgi:hypothetical protein